MTVVQVRAAPDQRVDGDADLVLDLDGPQAAGSNVQWDSRHAQLLKGLVPSPAATDFLRLAITVFCVDKLLLRVDTSDAWTRDVELRVPMHHEDAFRAQAPTLERALNFLSGDRWALAFETHPHEPAARPDQLVPAAVDAVSLLSGGLDSLAGAIDQLAAGDRVVFVAHFDAGITPHRQSALWTELRDADLAGAAVALRRLFLRPRSGSAGVHHPLPGGEGEKSTRARSLLFIAAGVAVADAIGAQCPLVIPENGLIGINVPLTAAREGSLSTRTTHPYFVSLVQEALAGIGLDHELRNPYRLATKGEILADSADADLLRRLAPTSRPARTPRRRGTEPAKRATAAIAGRA